MLRPRIIPCLLIRDGGLVKTQKFKNEKYVGDPINAVKIFNEKSVDELIFLDIDASREGKEPNYKLIQKLADESRMPLCYGGGIKNVEQAEKIIHAGIEKIAISSSAFSDPKLITEISKSVGSQSIVCVLDVKKSILGSYSIYIFNGTKKINGNLKYWLETFENLGAGEILINSIDLDGMQTGYDLNLANIVNNNINIPSTILGGASSMSDIGELIASKGLGGCAAGSLFVFKGKYRAVLINYPSFQEKNDLIMKSYNRYQKL